VTQRLRQYLTSLWASAFDRQRAGGSVCGVPPDWPTPSWNGRVLIVDMQRVMSPAKGNQMKMTFAVLALCAFAQGALAAGPDCRAIESTSGRLACYDAAHPPKMEKPTAVENDASRTAYKDPFIVEDARTAAKLKTICRGC
jgi:hypothetical protein